MELVILSIKGDAKAVGFAFGFVTIIFVILTIIDLAGLYSKARKANSKFSFPRWYLYPFIFWIAFFVYNVFIQNKLSEINEPNLGSTNQVVLTEKEEINSPNDLIVNQTINCTEEQRSYFDQREAYFQEYRNSGDNSLLSDEAHERFLSYCNSYSNINNWRGRLKSASQISDGTTIIDLECCDKPLTLLVSQLPESVMRLLQNDVIVVFSGKKHYDRLNGEFLKGTYNSTECSFVVENKVNQ